MTSNWGRPCLTWASIWAYSMFTTLTWIPVSLVNGS